MVSIANSVVQSIVIFFLWNPILEKATRKFENGPNFHFSNAYNLVKIASILKQTNTTCLSCCCVSSYIILFVFTRLSSLVAPLVWFALSSSFLSKCFAQRSFLCHCSHPWLWSNAPSLSCLLGSENARCIGCSLILLWRLTHNVRYISIAQECSWLGLQLRGFFHFIFCVEKYLFELSKIEHTSSKQQSNSNRIFTGYIPVQSVSYTHLTLPTIYSV